MTRLLRTVFSFFASLILTKLMERAFNPRVGNPTPQAEPKIFAMDMKACPRCGVFTTMPCTNPDCQKA